jgi:N-acetylneuraminic acid mutarotase
MDNDKTFDDLFIFNTITKSWSKPETTGHKPSRRCAHSATVIGTKFYIYGGSDLNVFPPETMNDMYCLNTELMEWSTFVMVESKPRLNAAMLPISVNGLDTLLLFGGLDLEGVYNDIVLLEQQ